MHFDDRLATVLRTRPGGGQAMATQFRQLVDLLASNTHTSRTVEAGHRRIDQLNLRLPPAIRARVLRDLGLRNRNPRLVAQFATQEPAVAAAAISGARLDHAQWRTLIPELPIGARGYLRHRRDLDAETQRVLGQLGAQDFVLPEPERAAGALEQEAIEDQLSTTAGPASSPLQPAPANRSTQIGAIVERIESYRRKREERDAVQRKPGASLDTLADDPRLPLDTMADGGASDGDNWRAQAIEFTTDADGRIDWANADHAPMLAGMLLAAPHAEGPVRPDTAMQHAVIANQPIRASRLELDGAPAIAGVWRVDAMPRFTRGQGRFVGYAGRLRRPGTAGAVEPALSPEADRLRQVLHELRTPVNAIQLSAEMLQQQVHGPISNQYRAMAAGIAGDAARILAGFDELDRLVRLETGALDLDEGESDFAAILRAMTDQLAEAGRQRNNSVALDVSGSAVIALSPDEAEGLAWRLLGTLAGALAPGEKLRMEVGQEAGNVRLSASLPHSLAKREDLFAAAQQGKGSPVVAGSFGAGFALRLARAEARAAGGDLVREGGSVMLDLPLLTGPAARERRV